MKNTILVLAFCLGAHNVFSQKNDVFDTIFKTYSNKRIEIIKSAEKSDISKQNLLNEDLNQYYAQKYVPMLKFLKKEICQNNNLDLLKRFLVFLDANSSSVDELSFCTLAEIYLVHPNTVLNTIVTYKSNYVLLSGLEYGFFIVADSTKENYKILKEKLELRIKEQKK
jgi:hypothetical protein